MKKITLLVAAVLMALPAMPVQAKTNQFTLPANAVEVAPNVYSLGKAYDSKTDSFVEGYAIVHKKANAKSSSAKPSGAGKTQCYGFLADSAKWKGAPEAWQVNAANSGLAESFLYANTAANISKWENAARYDIMGNGSIVTGAPTDKNVFDDINEVSFGPLDSGTIAVTTVWGYFSGPLASRQLVEWDQTFNTNYSWSSSAEAGKMDFENISTHELGHAVGMGDIYTSSCSQVTMFGYADNGEINKRSLESADNAGVSALYK